MRPRKIHTLLLAAAITGVAMPAEACRLRSNNSITLLPELPAAAYQEDVVARIEVIELVGNSEHSWFAKVRVVTAIKGTQVDQVIVATTGGSSCDWEFSKASLGVQAYIAGHMWTDARGEATFVGQWQAYPRPGSERLKMR